MTEMRALSGLRLGEELYVSDIGVNAQLREILRGMGVDVGTRIKCVLVSPLGDPKAYDICGAVIALRCEDADRVLGFASE